MNKISLRIADLRKEFWNQKLEYLLRTRKSYWNDDYTRFLISRVWKIDKPVSVLDCGCGYGFLGLLLLPYLPEGSTYTGIDFAEDLIKKGKALFAGIFFLENFAFFCMISFCTIDNH